MKMYIKNPIPVAAVLVDKAFEQEIIKLLDSGTTGWQPVKERGSDEIVGYMVHAWEGIEPVMYGSDYWIIRGIHGECYPCAGDVFRESYTEYRVED